MRTVRNKIFIFSATLIIALAGLSTVVFLHFSAILAETAKLGRTAELTPSIKELIHELQKERGRSAGFVGSSGNVGLGSKLAAQRLKTDSQFAALDAAFSSFKATAGDSPLILKLETAQKQLAELDVTRQSVDRLSISVAGMAKWYTVTIVKLLDVLKSMKALTTDGEIRTAITAYMALLEAKERAGQERALGNNGFATGRFSAHILSRFVGLIGEQDAFLRTFREHATDEQVAFFNNTVQGEAVEAVDRMRLVAQRSPFMGADANLDNIKSSDWFSAKTSKINMLKAVEDRLTDNLVELKTAKENQAQNAIIWVLAIIVPIMIGGSVFAYIVAVGVAQPLRRLSEVMRRLADGDLSATAPGAERKDEIGELARSVTVIHERRVEAMRVHEALNAASAMMMVADANNDIVYANPSVLEMPTAAEADIREDLPKFDARNLIGANIDIFHKNPAHQQRIVADLTRRTDARINVGGRTMSLAVSPIHDASGTRLGTVVEWRDMTAELSATDEIDAVVAAALEGDFTRRASLAGAPQVLKEMGERLNSVASSVDAGVDETARVLRAIAGGDLTQTFTGEFKGAFSALQRDTNATSSRLASMVADISTSTEAVQGGAEQISSGATTLSSRAAQQASSLEETAATMEEMSATINANADNATRATKLATEASERAKKGDQVVSEAVIAMSEIEQSSNKITDIISVIDAIAFQTNLLALNAAVEAARAGDAGKGFAVVASEVRTLAQRSSEAARDIKDLITVSSNKVADGVRLVRDTGGALEGILNAIDQVSESIGEISGASREQAGGVSEISSAVAHMDEMTQQNSGLAEQSASSARELATEAERLSQLMSFFRVGAAAPTAAGNSGTEAVADSSWKAVEKSAGDQPAPLKASGGDWEDF